MTSTTKTSPTLAASVDVIAAALSAKAYLRCDCYGLLTQDERGALGEDEHGNEFAYEVVIREEDLGPDEWGAPYLFVEAAGAAKAALEWWEVAIHAPACDQVLRSH